ncbi:uncharacterized protein LOC128958978 [Oppia nitens]|uniref:uncharacterized protein LOC128958978 n=1 Tax=Oppia nitens TaxID=1686743 RepID=UPI0023D9ED87|nr:uncharacterized protein LOC128958978 [Oppia nitens]
MLYPIVTIICIVLKGQLTLQQNSKEFVNNNLNKPNVFDIKSGNPFEMRAYVDTSSVTGADVLKKLIESSALNRVSGLQVLRSLDPLSGGILSKTLNINDDENMKQSLNMISGTQLLRLLDSVSGGRVFVSFESIAGDAVINALQQNSQHFSPKYIRYLVDRPKRTSLDTMSGVSIGSAKKRSLDAMNGISLGEPSKRNFDEIDNSGFKGFNKRNFDEIDKTGFGGFVKRNFDEIDRSGFESFAKRNFDEIDRSAFNGFNKRNFDEIDRTGFKGFNKRNFDEIDRTGFGGFVKKADKTVAKVGVAKS